MGYAQDELSDMDKAAIYESGQRGGKTAIARQSMADAIKAGYKPIELEDIQHMRGSVPHFMGHPMDSWKTVERIERVCMKHGIIAHMPYHEVCYAMSKILSSQTNYEPGKRLPEAYKQLKMSVESATETATFEGKISARQARRSAQPAKFTQQLKKSFNEQKRK